MAAVFIEGDVTWKADPGEFYSEYGFLRNLIAWSGVDKYQIVFCTGNQNRVFVGNPSKMFNPVFVAADEARAGYEKYSQDYYVLKSN